MNAVTQYAPTSTSSAVKSWLVKLHELTIGRSTDKEALERMQLVLDQLEVGRYGESAFTRRSLEHVSSKCRFWPAYGELCGHLDEYLVSQRPSAPRIIAAPVIPDRVMPTDAEVSSVAVKLAQHWREQAEDRIAREAAMPEGHASKPLRDVTAKGDALQTMRAARGLKVPAEPKWPEEVYGGVPA